MSLEVQLYERTILYTNTVNVIGNYLLTKLMANLESVTDRFPQSAPPPCPQSAP